MLRRLLASAGLGLALFAAPALAQQQQPAAQWNYTIAPGGVGTATYPGNVVILGTCTGCGGGGALSVTDGSTTISPTSSLTFDGLTVSGSTPNATATVTGAPGNFTVGNEINFTYDISSTIGKDTVTNTLDIIGDEGLLLDGDNGITILKNIPSSDPDCADCLWSDNGVLVFSGTSPSLPATVPTAEFQEQQANGTNSSTTLSANTFGQRVINATKLNNITGASLSGNQITLPAGTFNIESIDSTHVADNSNVISRSRIYNVTTSTVINDGPPMHAATGCAEGCDTTNVDTVQATVTFASPTVIEIDTWGNMASDGGVATSSGDPEVYTDVLITKVG
jgi:hypothetical protein